MGGERTYATQEQKTGGGINKIFFEKKSRSENRNWRYRNTLNTIVITERGKEKTLSNAPRIRHGDGCRRVKADENGGCGGCSKNVNVYVCRF